MKSLVQSELGFSIRDGEASDLAVHERLSDALASIKEKLEIHRQVPDARTRLTLAVHEASLTGTKHSGDPYVQEQIIKARRAAFSALDTKNAAKRHEDQRAASLRRQMAEIMSWGRSHSRFVSELQRLYSQTLFDLKRFDLPEHLLVRAISELNAIFEIAVENGLSLECSRSRGR